MVSKSLPRGWKPTPGAAISVPFTVFGATKQGPHTAWTADGRLNCSPRWTHWRQGRVQPTQPPARSCHCTRLDEWFRRALAEGVALFGVINLRLWKGRRELFKFEF